MAQYKITVYSYDDTGNLIQKIDAKNQKTVYGYDDAGRLTEVRYYAVSTNTVPAKTVTFSYDGVGNLIGYDDGVTSGTYEYDDAYRKVSESVDFGTFTKTNNYTYLKNGLKQTFTGPDNVAYGYLYDANNQLTGVQIPNVGYVTISEYTWNRPASMTLPGGSTRQYQYDPLMRVKQIVSKDPGQNELLNYQYTYDRMDNITAKDTEHGNYGYGYDDLYRLITADNPVQEDETFTYDGVGNRLTSADTTGSWSYNANNELESIDTTDVIYTYDANGNTTNQTNGTNSTSYVYNIEDRLTEVWDGEVGTGTLTASYYYDPFGRRLWKDVSGTRTYFHYSDEGLIGEYDSSGTEIKTYGYRPGSTWTTDPLFMKVGGEYYFYQNDHLGTPQKMTTVSGAVVWSAKYESFGKATVEVETVVNNLRFPGQYEDAETGLHYNWQRNYEPSVGRYAESDPVGLRGGVNVYAYVASNPLSNIDFEGLDYWMEGAVKEEAGWGFHQSVCVGKWNGQRKCISFGRMKGQSDCLFDCKGHVYYDKSAAGPIVANRYRYSDSATDARISAYFDKQIGNKSRWDVLGGENCRSYSQRLHDHLVDSYGGKTGSPPAPNPKSPQPPYPKKN